MKDTVENDRYISTVASHGHTGAEGLCFLGILFLVLSYESDPAVIGAKVTS